MTIFSKFKPITILLLGGLLGLAFASFFDSRGPDTGSVGTQTERGFSVDQVAQTNTLLTEYVVVEYV